MIKVVTILAVLALVALSFGQTTVFWYNATTNGYSISDCSPGPCITGSPVVAEGMVATGCVAQHSGASEPSFVFGSGLDDQQGRCGFFWAKDLDAATGSCTSAKIRAEFRDGWAGSAFCNSGTINIRCGVVDFQGNIDTWGGADWVPATADWQDFLNPLSSSMGYDFMSPSLQQEEVIAFTAPAGRPGEFDMAVLDGQFVEVDVTDQVNYILSNTGTFGIVCLVPPNEGNTGKVNTYSAEDGVLPSMGGDMPWTSDGNSAHLLCEGPVVVSIDNAPVKAVTTVSLSQNVPNPISKTTSIAYNTGKSASGMLKIYSPAGQMVHSASVSGSGHLNWSAGTLPNGLYMYRLTAGNQVVSKTMIIMK